MGKTVVRKWATRKIKTADFESVDVSSDITEEIEWKTEAEREEKLKHIGNVLAADMGVTVDQVLVALNLKEADIEKPNKKATEQSASTEKIAKTPKVSNPVKSGKAVDEIFDSL